MNAQKKKSIPDKDFLSRFAPVTQWNTRRRRLISKKLHPGRRGNAARGFA
jgi:hypothetical protein